MELPTSDFHALSVAEFDTTKLLSHAAKQAAVRGFHDFLIVDADCHHYENESFREIVDFIENPVLRQLAKAATQGTGASGLFPPPTGYQDLGGRITRYPLRKIEKTPPSEIHRDAILTRRWMDAMGVDYACLFPSPMLTLGLHPQPEVEAGLARAYNRWLIEKVLPGEPRLKSMLYLPFNDPEAAYQIVREFGDKSGVIGFMVVSARYKPVHDNAYVKTYAAIEERGLPLAFHGSYNWYDQMLSLTNRFLTVHALGFTLFSVVHCMNWIVNGLPERFPKLKVIWIESGLAWIPWVMQRLDNSYRMRSSEAPSLKRLPSEYMREMYYTSQPMEIPTDLSVLETTFKMINAETQLLWASDYPHWDMDLPSVIYDLPFLNERAKRNILGENARRLFNLDVSDRFPTKSPQPTGIA
ncbi:MAG: amidohydrolase [Chloroflexi bacterium]|nr:amidohydrolase [Chloroflexota bacterium]